MSVMRVKSRTTPPKNIKMELFVTNVKRWKPLTIYRRSSILVIVVVLNPVWAVL